MSFVPMMWTVWAFFVAIMAALYVYRVGLTRDEEDQIFLDDSFDHERAEQAVISARVAKVEPLIAAARWVVATMTVFVIAYYIRDILLELHVI
jgi:hypothetical protein